MITKDISKSEKLASLSKDSLILFLMLIPNLDSHGKRNGSPHSIKGEVVPFLKNFTIKVIEKCLKEIDEKTNLKWFMDGGLYWIHATSWKEHQNLDPKKIGRDELPSYSEVTPKLVSHEVEGEVEVEVKNEVKAQKEIEKRFEMIWMDYPSKDGLKAARTHFIKSVVSDRDWEDIQKALKNYLATDRVKNGYIKNGSTWFNNWKDWVDYIEPPKGGSNGAVIAPKASPGKYADRV